MSIELARRSLVQGATDISGLPEDTKKRALELSAYFTDLDDERFESALALVHSRFSTNTFPSWPLAHPYRYIAHNGEINTVRGNRNWMRAREALLRGPHELPDDLSRLFPVCTPGASDSASSMQRTQSWMWMKARVWPPVPWTVSG